MKTVLDLTWKWEAQRTTSCTRIQKGSTLSARSWKITGDFLLQFMGQGNDSCFSRADHLRQMSKLWGGGEKCQLEQGKSQSNLSPSCLSPKGRGMGNERRHQNKLCVLCCSCTVRLWISHQSQSSQPFTLLALLLGCSQTKARYGIYEEEALCQSSTWPKRGDPHHWDPQASGGQHS